MAEEVKRVLEQFKIKADSMEQKLAGHPQLQNNFKTAVTDAAKIIETLKDSLKVFEQQRIEKERIEEEKRKAKAGFHQPIEKRTQKIFAQFSSSINNVSIVALALALSEPKRRMTNILEKLPEVITILGKLKNEAQLGSSFLDEINVSIKYAGELSKALKAALKVEDKDMEIEYMKKKSGALSARVHDLPTYAKKIYPEIPKKVEELQKSAYDTIEEIRKIIHLKV
ncbi:hypothetical protein Ddc_23674 [Ditylenchus destructor]|nr:hypothetical protein Ddc_23674 [Ditylenchus destructor]